MRRTGIGLALLAGAMVALGLRCRTSGSRGDDGEESSRRIPKPLDTAVSERSLARRLSKSGISPGVGIPTASLRVRLPASEARKVAKAFGLKVGSVPAHAPGWVVFAAPDPSAALRAEHRIRRAFGLDEFAASVLYARQLVPKSSPGDPLYGSQWHLTGVPSSIGAESVWNYPGSGGFRGRGVRMAIVDDGVDLGHEDLALAIDPTLGYDWNDGDADPGPGSGDDHGTACAGIALARGANGLGGLGVAPEATLAALRLIAAPTTDAQEAEAIAWANDRIDIKSNSWGPPDGVSSLQGPGPLTRLALEDATTHGRGGRGVILLSAAGNGHAAGDSSNYDGYANSIHTIAVGAVDSLDRPAYYSEGGANVVVCAPSEGGSGTLGITTTDRTGPVGFDPGDYTGGFGGSSAATPAVAGVVALMLEAQPSLGWRDVQEILIRSAGKPSPASSEWETNGAGLSFHPRMGAGRVDAVAAVDLCPSWVPLRPAQVLECPMPTSDLFIPDQSATGVVVSFEVPDADVRVEHVTVEVDIRHSARGNLEITLTSPQGSRSRLAGLRNDTAADYESWTFSSVRHWGEVAAGTWSLRVADRSGLANTAGGVLHGAVLRVRGATFEPHNPPPDVDLALSPSGGFLSPGATLAIEVDASDRTAEGSVGEITTVELRDNGVAVATWSAPPYSHTYQPAPGDHVIEAVAIDSEGAEGRSPPRLVRVENRRPEIVEARLGGAGIRRVGDRLAVDWVDVRDADGDTMVLLYQWQRSDDGLVFVDAPGETGPTLASAVPGIMWRCRVTAADDGGPGIPGFTESVQLLGRPPLAVSPGDMWSYRSELVVPPSPLESDPPVEIHEFSQGPSGGLSEWIEILTRQPVDLGFWDLSTPSGTLVFKDDPVWAGIPAGTLIVIYPGGVPKDPLLPADDLDPSDGTMVLASTDPTRFDSRFDSWAGLSDLGSVLTLSDPAAVPVDSIAYGPSEPGSIGVVGSGISAHRAGSGGWEIVPSAEASAAAANDAGDAQAIAALTAGNAGVPASFRVAEGDSLPPGVTLDAATGLLSGTVPLGTAPGSHAFTVERVNLEGLIAAEPVSVTVGAAGGFDAWAAGLPDLSPDGDPDRDGIPSEVEYATGGSAAAFGSLPVPVGSGTGFAWEFSLAKHATDVELLVEWTDELLIPLWRRDGIRQVVVAEDGEAWRIRAELPSGHPRAFLRLRTIRHP